MLEGLTLTRLGDGWESRGLRHGSYVYDPPPAERGSGAGTVHHVAWSVPLDEHVSWVETAIEPRRPTPVIDRFWFHSIYFREPSGVLFEIASLGPGFGIDEDPEHLGEEADLPRRLSTSAPRSSRSDASPGIDAHDCPRAPGRGDAVGALVLFHGRGADENDLFPTRRRAVGKRCGLAGAAPVEEDERSDRAPPDQALAEIRCAWIRERRQLRLDLGAEVLKRQQAGISFSPRCSRGILMIAKPGPSEAIHEEHAAGSRK